MNLLKLSPIFTHVFLLVVPSDTGGYKSSFKKFFSADNKVEDHLIFTQVLPYW